MKRLVSLAAAGLMCGAAVLGTTSIASASSIHTTPARMHIAQPGGPMVRVPGAGGFPTISENWSGYGVVSKNAFNSVQATWVEPTIKCTGVAHQMTSNWVGLDGFNDQTVEQDGTSAWCGGPSHTTPMYVAWYEMFPASSANVFKVNAGDIIDASVNYTGGNFVLTVSDATRGVSHTFTGACTNCTRTSAEWIIERPAYCNAAFTRCDLFALPNFGTSTMSGDTASLNGRPAESMGHLGAIPISMIQPLNKGFISLDTVNATSGTSYTAQWDRSGTIVPIQLGPNS
jgi:Peptidase A4 family